MSLFPSKVPLIVIPHPLSKRTQKHVEYLCLEIHTSFFHFPLTESPWGLPVVADGPASLAKVVMAELARLKLENKPWPGGKGCSPAGGTGCLSEAESPQPTRGGIHSLEIWWTASGEGTLPGWGTQRPEPQSPGGGWDLVSRGLAPRDRTGRLGRWFCWALPPPRACVSASLSQ